MGKFIRNSRKRDAFIRGSYSLQSSSIGERAQAASPFELFVAVIIMGFVIIVGYQVLAEVKKQVCLNNVDKELTKFKQNLEETVARKSSTNFTFYPEGACYDSPKTVVNIEVLKVRQYCDNLCGSPMDECYVLKFSNPGVSYASKQKCLNLPAYTSFLISECDPGGTELTTYEPINPLNNIPRGFYALRNVSAAGETFTKICAYHKLA